MSEEFDPRCEKCGAEITTGLMAVFCTRGRECEFWVPGVEEFREELRIEEVKKP